MSSAVAMDATFQQIPSSVLTGPSIAVPSGSSSQNLLLDSDIRDWVVLPLLVIMVVAGLLRNALSKYLRGASSRAVSPIESRARSAIQRSARLRSSGGGAYLSSLKWEARRRYMSRKGEGDSENGGGDGDDSSSFLREESVVAKRDKEAAAEAGVDLANPLAMMDGMKGNMVFMVQNMVMMQGISHFFQGYVLLRVPFPLTNGFKQMFQRGLHDLSTLDTSYVSSVSWYFLVMFGLRAFFRLAIGDPPQEVREGAFAQHSLGTLVHAPPAGPQQFNAAEALKTEADNLELTVMRSVLDDAEKRLLGKRFPKKKIVKGKNAGDDIFGLSSSKTRGAAANNNKGAGSKKRHNKEE